MIVKYHKIWAYPGNITRKEATVLLGFDPGPVTNKKEVFGIVTKVDRENGIVTIGAIPPNAFCKDCDNLIVNCVCNTGSKPATKDEK